MRLKVLSGQRHSNSHYSDTSPEISTTDDTDDTDGRECTLILSVQSVLSLQSVVIFQKCRCSADLIFRYLIVILIRGCP